MGAFIVATAADTAATGVTPGTKLAPQTTCPIMGGDINKELFVDYNGKRIYVCCGGCIDAVKKDPEAAIKNLAAMGQIAEAVPVKEKVASETALKPQEHCPVMTVNKISKKLFVDHDGKRIYVCCGDCLSKVKADPEKYLEVLKAMGEKAGEIPAKKM